MYYFIIFYKFNYTLLPSLKYKRKTSNFTKFEVNLIGFYSPYLKNYIFSTSIASKSIFICDPSSKKRYSIPFACQK